MSKGPEAELQSAIVSFLKSKGCVTIKNQAGPGVPKGTADLVFFKEGFYGFIEVKAHKNSPFQIGQKEFLKKMDEWSFARAVYRENWSEVKQELSEML